MTIPPTPQSEANTNYLGSDVQILYQMPPSIAVVVLDSLRHDSFTKLFDWLPGTHFSNAYSTSHWTVPAHASLFTGYYPSEVGVHSKSLALDCSRPTLAEVMSEVGYVTRCFTANPNIAYWDGWRRGFDEVVEPANLDPRYEGLVDWTSFVKQLNVSGPRKIAHCIHHCVEADVPTLRALRQGYRYWRQSSADGGTAAIIERVDTADFGESEFLVINLMETHTPYHAPDDGDSVDVVIGDAFADDVGDEDRIRSAYAESVEYLSRLYRELFDRLTREFDYVLTLGDHGELLGEDGMWNHGYGLYPELVQIPLVVSGPNVEDKICETPVSILDVHQTVAKLVDTTVDSRGQDLLDSPEPKARLTEYHGFTPWHEDQFKRKGVPASVYGKYDSMLRGILTPEGRYSYETHDNGFRTADGDPIEDASSRVETLIDELNCKPVRESVMNVDDEVKDRLEDLGYA